jgi:hypothetical protein
MKRTAISLVALAVAAALYLLSDYPGHPTDRPAVSGSEAPRPSAQGAPPPLSGASFEEEWSDTDPAVNLAHIFHGEINRRGKPVGFHSRPGGRDPARARVRRVLDRPNGLGVYTAEVEIRNSSGRWLKKRSTFYPDRLGREQVVAAILRAWEEREETEGNKFRGPSGEGFTIEGYTNEDGAINTAYPIFDEGQ